jgi:hypothetical protein
VSADNLPPELREQLTRANHAEDEPTREARAALDRLGDAIRKAKIRERDAYAAGLLRAQARQLRTEVYGRVYDDAGQRAASGVLRAADHLDETAYEADPDAKPITDHAWWAGEGGQCWHGIENDKPCDAPRIAHQTNEQEPTA